MAKISTEYNLKVLYPAIAAQWHPSKNEKSSPDDFFSKSGEKAWWICKNNHEWESAICSRTKGSGCPYCSNQSSEPEIRILSELKWFFDEVNSRYKVDSVEIDIFLPNFNIGIEYDGKYWHKDNEDSDLEKNKFFF